MGRTPRGGVAWVHCLLCKSVCELNAAPCYRATACAELGARAQEGRGSNPQPQTLKTPPQNWVRERMKDAGLPRPDKVFMVSSTKGSGIRELVENVKASMGLRWVDGSRPMPMAAWLHGCVAA
jgi:hypothetical protein